MALITSQEQSCEILDVAVGRDALTQVQSGVALSPEKAMLKHEVSQLREHPFHVQDQAESYVKAVKIFLPWTKPKLSLPIRW